MSKDLRILIRRILKENDDVVDLNAYRKSKAMQKKEVLPQIDPLKALLEKINSDLDTYFEENKDKNPDLNNRYYLTTLRISKILKDVLKSDEEEFQKATQDDFLAYMNAVPYDEDDEDY